MELRWVALHPPSTLPLPPPPSPPLPGRQSGRVHTEEPHACRSTMHVCDDVWSKILAHHGPLDLIRDDVARRAVAASRVQGVWRRRRPGVGDRVRVRLGRVEEEGVVVNKTHTSGRRWCTILLRQGDRSRYVFLSTASGRGGPLARRPSPPVLGR